MDRTKKCMQINGIEEWYVKNECGLSGGRKAGKEEIIIKKK